MKKAKTTTFDNILNPNIRTTECETRLRQDYLTATPYKHACINNVFEPNFLTTCKEEIKAHSKVNFKETDLFRVYQSLDLANLEEPSQNYGATSDQELTAAQQLAQKMPAVMQLRQVLYSQEWRSYIERITQLPPGSLNNQIDCACNCHAPGCHLLCHDDVIGTRKISYILYLTEPNWMESEGGALELYDSKIVDGKNGTAPSSENSAVLVSRREPDSIPSKRLLPHFNSMAFFVVEPGVSFHAVQEVMGERPRLSVQGWYHAVSAPEHVEHATLSRLKEPSKSNHDEANDVDAFTPLKDERVQPLEQQRKQRAANADKLLDSDRDYLALFVNETYLTKAAMEEIRERFEEDSSVQLRHFFRASWMQSIKDAIAGEDYLQTEKDSESNNQHSARPKVGENGYYEWGVSDEWKLVGPPHKQRYLQYQSQSKVIATNDKTTKDPLAQALPPKTSSTGLLMDQLKQKVMQSPAFARYLNYITSLGVPLGYKGQVRRFRPGLDYTVAHYGILTQTAVLDATICFVAGTGGVGAPSTEEKNTEEKEGSNATAKAPDSEDENKQDHSDEDFEPDYADVLWQSDDVGGFECYIEADDYDKKNEDDDKKDSGAAIEEVEAAGQNDKGVTVAEAPSNEPAEEYNAEDDTNLLSVSASNNTLSLVYRDPGTMRFIKYVGSRAPSSRWDISMEYQVPEGEHEDS